jgi:phosphoglycolate phosphatase-like HAD superfamily hydrolase
MNRLRFPLLAAIAACVLIRPAAAQTDPLPSWNDGPARQAIVTFVARVTDEGSAEFVPAAERIATFDNDGTLMCEQPFYFQGLFLIDRVQALAPQHPEWKEQQPFQAVLEGNWTLLAKGGSKAVGELTAATHAGLTTDEFDTIAKEWLTTARHARFKRAYTDLVYQPMLELLAWLRARGFKTYVSSGSSVEFLRTFSNKAYGIPPEQVIGSGIRTKYEIRDGRPVLMRLPEIESINNDVEKPVGIQRHIGRRPILAFGNSDGDFEMLEWTTSGSGPRMALYLHHDDGEREWAYDRKSPVGRLDRGLDEAPRRGWTVVSMKNDFRIVFPFETK